LNNTMLISRRAVAVGALLALVGSLMLTPIAHAARPRCLGKRATIVGTNRSDRLRGTSRADVIVAKGGNDRIRGRGGNDRICAGGGRDSVAAGDGGDRVAAGSGSDFVLGGSGGDRIFLEGGVEEAGIGGGGNDVIDLGPGIFQFAAGQAGDDTIIGFEPEAGPSLDFTGYFDAPGPVTVDLTAGTATGHGTDTLVSIDAAEGSEFDDTLIGTSGSNFLTGLGGNDTIESGGNTGDLDSPVTVFELRFDFLAGDAGDDSITGGAGANVIAHDLAPNGVDVDLQAGTSTGDGTDTLSGIQIALGTQFDDTLRGDNGDNVFEGEGGTDTIDGRGGVDTYSLLDAEAGEVDLGAGTATSTYRPFDPDTGEPGPPVPSAVSLTGIENVWGSDGDDVIRGDNGPNRLFGLFGSDDLFGLGGDDYLDGGPEVEPGEVNTLDGGDGTDTCVNGTPTNCEIQVPAAAVRRLGAASEAWSGIGAALWSRRMGR
jgi:Ca2+-binding RTX toxin-like protein